MSKLNNKNSIVWEIPVENYEKFDIKLLEKIYTEGNEYFNGQVDDIHSLVNKAYTTLSIIISIIGILLSFLINKIGVIITINQKPIFLIVIILMIICSYCIYLLISIVFPKNMNVKGEQPKPINFNALEEIEINQQYKIFIFNSIETIQSKINTNELLLQGRIIKFEKVLTISSITFLLSILIITILLFLI